MESDLEIRELVEKYREIEDIVDERLHSVLDVDKNSLLLITHRIKTMPSIKGKLVKKAGHYTGIQDVRDILGFRVICYFLRDVDKVAELIAQNFRIDWDRSKDKRQLIDVRSFGYLSLHYICALPEEYGEQSDLWFEIQIKTILQHSWAEIEHDLGYKSEIEIPREIRRSFSKAASLLETTDDIFADIAKKLDEYRALVDESVKNESLDDLYFDSLTLAKFTAHNKEYQSLLKEIAAITDAQIIEGSPETQLPLIEFLGIKTLGDMTRLIREQHDLALELAHRSLDGLELDEYVSTAAYYYLFRAKLIAGDYSRERIREFMGLSLENEALIEDYTNMIMEYREYILRSKA